MKQKEIDMLLIKEFGNNFLWSASDNESMIFYISNKCKETKFVIENINDKENVENVINLAKELIKKGEIK